MNHHEQQTFLKAIAVNPTDTNLRLVYADWLEDQGLGHDADRQRWEARLSADPYDRMARTEFARWLTKRGDEAEAWQQQWMVRAIQGRVTRKLPLALITRQGIAIDDKYTKGEGFWRTRKSVLQKRTYWLRLAGTLFAAHPDIHFIVVSDATPTNQGFRYERPADGLYRSPILFYRRSDNWEHARPSKVSRVLASPFRLAGREARGSKEGGRVTWS